MLLGNLAPGSAVQLELHQLDMGAQESQPLTRIEVPAGQLPRNRGVSHMAELLPMWGGISEGRGPWS